MDLIKRERHTPKGTYTFPLQDFRCPFTENCNITPVTRRFCQKCRLDKCFSIGMRKEYIMSEEDKVLKRKKIEKNRAKKRSQSDNAKASKIKKDCVEDCTFDDTSMSVNSVVSTISETYFWESDRKYTDLDGNRQNVVESMSPVTAASVPSPSSPPESTNIAETKTLDMLKESSHGPRSNLARYEHTESESNDVTTIIATRYRISNFSCSRARFGSDFNVTPQTAEKDRHFPATTNSGKYEQNALHFSPEFVTVNGESSRYSSPFKANAPDYSRFEQGREQDSLVGYVDRMSGIGGQPELNTPLHAQLVKEEATMCQKPKETCSSGNSLLAKFKQDPGLLAKFVSNPNLLAKIFQDQRVLMRIMTDPDMATCLAADPHIARFLEENDAVGTTDDVPGDERGDKAERSQSRVPRVPRVDDDNLDNAARHAKSKGSHVENPILTDLITNRHAEECKNQTLEPTTSTDWNKNTADVTRDVLQDVQRLYIYV